MKKSYLGILLAGVLTGCFEPSTGSETASKATAQITDLSACRSDSGCKLVRVDTQPYGNGDLIAYDLARKQPLVTSLAYTSRDGKTRTFPEFISAQNLKRANQGEDSYYLHFFSNPRGQCFTGGDSSNMGFQLFCQEGVAYRAVYSLDSESKRGLLPFASDADRMFLHHDDPWTDWRSRQNEVVRWDSEQRELIPFPAVKVSPGEIIGSGAIVKDQLYYTGYRPDPANEYSTIYRLDLGIPGSTAEAVEPELPGYLILHSHGEQLYIDDGETLNPLDGGRSFASQEANYFDSLSHTLIQIDSRPDGPQDEPWSNGGAIRAKEDGSGAEVAGSPYGDLIVTDTRTGKVIATVPDQYGFEFEGNELVVYAAGTIERIALD